MDNRKELQDKIKKETGKYSKAAEAIEKFYTDASKGKVYEKDFPHDHVKIALKNQKVIVELLDQLKKL